MSSKIDPAYVTCISNDLYASPEGHPGIPMDEEGYGYTFPLVLLEAKAYWGLTYRGLRAALRYTPAHEWTGSSDFWVGLSVYEPEFLAHLQAYGFVEQHVHTLLPHSPTALDLTISAQNLLDRVLRMGHVVRGEITVREDPDTDPAHAVGVPGQAMGTWYDLSVSPYFGEAVRGPHYPARTGAL
jgi:hypothetical protein